MHAVPDFSADTSMGPIKFHEWIGDSWAVLFSHPADYTPVCTTELGTVAKMQAEFDKRGCKTIALSCNDSSSHKGWIEDIKATQGVSEFTYPIIADEKRDLAVQWGMVDPDEKDAAGLPMTCRAVFVISPDKKLKLQILYPATTGRNFHEVLRVIDSLQLTANHSVFARAHRLPDLSVWQGGSPRAPLPLSVGRRALRAGAPRDQKAYSELMRNARFQVATPANWTDGGNCMVVPSLTDEQVSAFVLLFLLCRARV